MELLAPPPPAEMPPETLLVHLRSRRAAIDPTGATGGVVTPGELLTYLLPRLDHRLRRALDPCLQVAAMHVLVVALRYRLAGIAPPPALLRQPWLAGGMRPLVEASGTAAAVVGRVQAALAGRWPLARTLTSAFRSQGPGGVESCLTAGVLSQAVTEAREPVVQMALRFAVDLRNLLAVLRHWRWQLRQAPPLLAGGTLGEARLTGVWLRKDHAAFDLLAKRLDPAWQPELEPCAAEHRLLQALGKRLRHAGRDPLGVGVILDTLWRCQIAAGNRALRQEGGTQADTLPREAFL